MHAQDRRADDRGWWLVILDDHDLFGAASIIAGGIASQYGATPENDAKVAVRAVSIARNIDRHIAESVDSLRTLGSPGDASYPVGSPVRVWARPFATYGENPIAARNGLICVELPPNCSIDGDHGTMHKMITDLLAITDELEDGSDLALESIARFADIREWLARNPL